MRKLILSVFLSFYLLFSALISPVSSAQAQVNPWYAQDFSQFYTKVYDPNNPAEIFGERYTAASTHWIIYSVISWPFVLVAGPDVVYCFWSGNLTAACIKDGLEGFFSVIDGFILGAGLISDSSIEEEKLTPITLLSDIKQKNSLSTLNYFDRSILSNLEVDTASAQGFGYTNLAVFSIIWAGFRNVSYTLMVLIVIVYALMIMFKVKLSPQTVISIQSALPKIFLTLVYITFSYAIVGFLVDIMYVVIALLSWVAVEGGMVLPSKSVRDVYNSLTGGPIANIGPLQLGVFGWIVVYFIMFFIAFLAGLAALFPAFQIT